ncbi:MAG: efflux RND transporter periplasmic adaptor subunit [Acidobacteriota bacterium]
MSSKDQENNLVETEPDEQPLEPEGGSHKRRAFFTRERFANRRYIVATFAIVAVTVLIVFLIWISRTDEGGKPVPAPRTTSFGETNTGMPIGEMTLTLAPEMAERAGIQIGTVGEKLATEEGMAPTTGTVQANAYRETPVISLVGGIVRRVDLELGQAISRGQRVAVISSEELSQTESRYLTLQKEVETARQNYARQEKLVRISPVSSAELDQALARLKAVQAEYEEHHSHHVRTTRLVAIGAVSREELEQATTKFRTVEADLTEARRRYDRALQVAEIDPLSRSAFEEAAVKVRNSESELSAVRERLRLLGLPPGQINSLRSPSQISTELPVTAPVSGVATSRSINVGEVVAANKELLRITDLSTVWVIAQVYEKDLGRIRTGTGATVTSNSYPGEVFRGHVTYIDPNIDQQTRTAQVRVELGNANRRLMIGMYVAVAFGSRGQGERTMPVVPVAAVQNINNQRVIFLPTDQPNVFRIRSISLGPESDGYFPVLEGVTVGDRIVTEGSFLLRAEWIKLHPEQF